MTAIRDWIARRSGLELVFVFGVTFGVILGLIGPGTGLRLDIVGYLIAGVLFGVLMSAVTLWTRRRSGGRDRNVQINSAIQSGDLPVLIEPTVWLDTLTLRLVDLHRSQVTIPIVFGIIVVSELAIGFFGPRLNYAFVVIAALVALAAVASVVSNRNLIPKIEVLAQRIRETYNLS